MSPGHPLSKRSPRLPPCPRIYPVGKIFTSGVCVCVFSDETEHAGITVVRSASVAVVTIARAQVCYIDLMGRQPHHPHIRVCVVTVVTVVRAIRGAISDVLSGFRHTIEQLASTKPVARHKHKLSVVVVVSKTKTPFVCRILKK